MNSNTPNIISIRSEIRERRRLLSDSQQYQAAEDLFANLIQLHVVKTSKRIACYLPTDGEIDPTPLMDWALQSGRSCYLPVLSHINGNRLLFAPVNYDSDMGINRFGIPEPLVPLRKLVRASRLDLILLPLVGFDTDGNRIGMGGGYYDRTLQLMRIRRQWRKPRLIGVAHELQLVDSIESRPWDIPLDGVVTDQNIYLFDRDSNESN